MKNYFMKETQKHVLKKIEKKFSLNYEQISGCSKLF